MTDFFIDGKKLYDFLDLLGTSTSADVLREQTIDHFFRYGELASHVAMRFQRTDHRSYPVGRSSENYSGDLYFVGRGYVKDNEQGRKDELSELHSLYVLAILKKRNVSEIKQNIKLLTIDNHGAFSIYFPDGFGFNGLLYVPKK